MTQEALAYYTEHFNKQEGQKYPCSNQSVVCGVITNDRDKALEFMSGKEVVKKREHCDRIEWVLPNGETWLWRKWNENCRGYRFYKIAVDWFIADEIFELLVMPRCKSYCCSMEVI